MFFCAICETTKPASDFYKKDKTCKKCRAERNKAIKSCQKDKTRERDKKYRAENKTKIEAQKKEYYEKNREEILRKDRHRYVANLQKNKTRHAAYRATHKKKISEYNFLYKAINATKFGAIFDRKLTQAMVFKEFGAVCYLCGMAIDMALLANHKFSATIDHIIPLSRGGSHNLENTRPAHLSCNSKKHDKMPSELKCFLPID